ncbi:hypothetical protein QAD02_001339 [Eretmocerus hayati]|uniref:Uncharacterized protein n=1 Tax=Eretmocerus hayati TaxID=131215 RepID=A0ACC2NKJ5_9HYME|nr:hypothetical protein QAD02_001339 [Eretmocerus hayati]
MVRREILRNTRYSNHPFLLSIRQTAIKTSVLAADQICEGYYGDRSSNGPSALVILAVHSSSKVDWLVCPRRLLAAGDRTNPQFLLVWLVTPNGLRNISAKENS